MVVHHEGDILTYLTVFHLFVGLHVTTGMYVCVFSNELKVEMTCCEPNQTSFTLRMLLLFVTI